MRKKLAEVYTDCNKETIDGMLLIIVEKDFNEDLWRTVWEVSNMVLEDMEKERKKEKMKQFLQSEEVKEMCRFAGEFGICGDLLRELRFKRTKEKMEENDFYESLEHSKDEKPAKDPKWAEAADKIHEKEEMVWPQESKPMSGKCELVMEKILSLKKEDDPSQLLADWIELLQPGRVDWITLLDRLEQQNPDIHLKVAKLVLNEKSFQTNSSDFTKLIGAYAKENRVEDAERILKKMAENGIMPDILTATALVHMYSKVGNIERATEAFESLRSYGFQPDMKIYTSMIMSYGNAGKRKFAESLMREMEPTTPSEEIYMALLQSYVHEGDALGAARISTTMQLNGYQPTAESCSLLVEA
ncbi:hypothetical protein PTKIN_Ptkin09bG0118600 [Pterospermum kingtungense]